MPLTKLNSRQIVLNPTASSAEIMSMLLTGYTGVAGTVAATDTIVVAMNKINGNIALRAPIASPVFTGNVTGLGVAAGTSFNLITALASVAPLIDGTATIGVSTAVARQDHIHPTDTTRSAVASPTFTGTATAPTFAATTNITSPSYASTVAIGTAPFTVTSTTVVGNLNVSQLLGSTWAVPPAIGSTTPGAGAFTTLTATTSATIPVINSSTTMGYSAGAGGTVTQITSRTTGVTLNKASGAITLVLAAGSAAWQSFIVTNSLVAITDTVELSQRSGTDLYMFSVTNVAAGSFRISFATTGGVTSESPVFNFNVIKGINT